MAELPKKGCALITGAGGRLGKLLRAARSDTPDLVHDFVFQSRNPGADLQWSPGQDTAILPKCKAVIALWGATSGTEDALKLNADLVTETVRVAREVGAQHVIHMSSAAVYGPGQTMAEDHPTSHCNAYGKSKLAMEDAVAQHRAEGDLHHICLRLANVVGADSLAPALRNTSPAMMDNFSPNPDTPQGPVRSYIGAGDLIRVLDGLLTLSGTEWPDHINIASSTTFAMDDLMRAANKDVIWQPAPPSATAEVTLDVSRLQALLPNLAHGTTAAELIAQWQRLESLG